MSVQIITDSTADFPAGIVEKLGIRIVPIYLRFGDKVYRDRTDIDKNTFYTMLQESPFHPATSQPNPEDFAAVYKEYCDNTDGIVSIHISSRISGTFNSANIARKTLGNCERIEIIDSKLNSGGLGMVVMAAATAARAGATFTEVINEALKAVHSVRMFGMFETMKYLARSGRVNKTIAAASRILNVMPLLTFHEGEIIRAGLVRSVNRGMDKIHEFVQNNKPVTELTIVHSRAEHKALELKKRLSSYIEEKKINIAELGAGLGVHGGPGVLLAAIRKG